MKKVYTFAPSEEGNLYHVHERYLGALHAPYRDAILRDLEIDFVGLHQEHFHDPLHDLFF